MEILALHWLCQKKRWSEHWCVSCSIMEVVGQKHSGRLSDSWKKRIEMLILSTINHNWNFSLLWCSELKWRRLCCHAIISLCIKEYSLISNTVDVHEHTYTHSHRSLHHSNRQRSWSHLAECVGCLQSQTLLMRLWKSTMWVLCLINCQLVPAILWTWA